MISWLLGVDGGAEVRYPELGFRTGWPSWLIFAMLALACAYAVYLYHREKALSVRKRVMYGVLRSVLYSLIILLLLEPVFSFETDIRMQRSVLVLLDASQSMDIRDPRRKNEDLVEPALALGKIPFPSDKEGQEKAFDGITEKTGRLPEAERRTLAQVTRMEVARKLLAHPKIDLNEQLSENFRVRFFAFGEKLKPLEGEGEQLAASLQKYEPTAEVSALGTAVDEAVNRYSGQTIAGVVLLTDGASNTGADPREVARRLGEFGIPVFPVGLGMPEPPDVEIKSLLAQEIVFLHDTVAVRVQLHSRGYDGRQTDLVLAIDGDEKARRRVTLKGGTQYEEIEFKAEQAGTVKLSVSVAGMKEEASVENNALDRRVKILDEKIDVVYIEGKPRWEYRYLRKVLLRDKRLKVNFIMTEGDPELPRYSRLYLSGFPTDPKRADKFDLVIVGDVNPTHFTAAQMERLDVLVRQRGGSFLMIAGHEYAPRAYKGTPIENILPIKIELAPNRTIPRTVYPRLTPEGRRSSLVRLDYPDSRNQDLWTHVSPMHELPVLQGIKPGAILLATLSETSGLGKHYPLICWQRYGTGKSMFVATDRLWRLRFKEGDTYHARFWGQTIQFLTLARLLGGNKRIQIEVDRNVFRAGERVPIYANVLNEAFDPVTAPSYTVHVTGTTPPQPVRPIKLQSVKGTPGLYEGFAPIDEPGQYEVKAPGESDKIASKAEFEVRKIALEQSELAMQREMLEDMAKASGGRFFSVPELPLLPKAIGGKNPTAVVRRQVDLWDSWVIFVILVTIAGVEWFFRRRNNLT